MLVFFTITAGGPAIRNWLSTLTAASALERTFKDLFFHRKDTTPQARAVKGLKDEGLIAQRRALDALRAGAGLIEAGSATAVTEEALAPVPCFRKKALSFIIMN